MKNLISFLLLLPLLSFILIFCLQNFKKTALTLAISTILVLTICSTFLFFGEELPFSWDLFILKVETSILHINFFLDNFSLYFLVIITFISSAVFIFSLEYMKNDKKITQYFAYLSLFIFTMLGLILAGNLLQIYIFWELVGLVSYLLIGFWKQQKSATNAAKLAFITNRIGDAGFLIGIFGVWNLAHSLDLQTLQTQKIIFPFWIGFGLFCGVIGKSAQFPLHFWLPKAMKGPTPVSALLHAATMVAAGIYLLIRISPFLPQELLATIAYFGGITALLGGFLALNHWDIKKILAYSTVSQLGFMVVGVGVGASWGAMFHLFTHAFFKAGLFLCAGSFIHYLHQNKTSLHAHTDAQDMQNMRNIVARFPLIFIFFSLFCASLIGLPFTSGFFSKEEILQNVFHTQHYFLLAMNLLSVFFTSFYVSRMWFLLYLLPQKKENTAQIFDIKKNILSLAEYISIGLLFFCSLLSGYVFFPETFGYQHKTHHQYFLLSSIILINLIGILFGYYLVRYKEGFFVNNFVMNLSKKELFIDTILIYFEKIIIWKINFVHQIEKKLDIFLLRIGQLPVVLSHILAWFDRNIIDGLTYFFSWLAKNIGTKFNQLQNGQLQNYLAWVIMIVMGIIWWLWK
ncbi:MAG: NADH-quinone oxidoreductase subunit L [Bacteroidetes bacterium]|nr:MAG: NADH-quinone oxidoreductase subunit L [Bacteroidota bacterium]TAG86381.1 MAG: NADH-quinone oxidoreductase subunit L [Bacteroidota bacterium]